MLIATSLALALLAAPLPAVAAVAAALPPMIVNVTSASDLSPALVTMMLRETEAIWRGVGFSVVWQREPYTPASLRVVVGHDAGRATESGTPLGWIVFDDESPEQEVYVSYRNALQLLEEWQGSVNRMTRSERDTLLARGMGRALAHEIGHYLLRSKQHTAKGLMRALWSAPEMFTNERVRFQISPEQQMVVASRLRQDALFASRGLLPGQKKRG